MSSEPHLVISADCHAGPPGGFDRALGALARRLDAKPGDRGQGDPASRAKWAGGSSGRPWLKD